MEKLDEKKKKWFMFLLFLVGLFLAFKFILPYFWPFIFAFIVVAPLNPLLERMAARLRVGKGILAGVLITGILVFIVFIGVFGGGLLVKSFGGFVDYSPKIQSQLNIVTTGFCESMETHFGVEAEYLENWMKIQTDDFMDDMETKLFPKIMNQSFLYAKNIGKVVIFLVTFWISAILLAKDYNRIKDKLCDNNYVRYTKNELKKLGGFMKSFLMAQLIISAIVSLVCVASLLLSGFSFATSFIVGILTGILDVFPFLGTGIVLLPLAVWKLLLGETQRFFILLAAFLITVIVREMMEPRLVGEKMGLWPVAMLMSIYVGGKVLGLGGLLLGPIYLIIAADWYYNAEIG